MFKALARMILKDEIKTLNDDVKYIQRDIEFYKEANTELRKDSDQLKDYKLQLRIAQMYVNDDDALLDLIEMVKEKEKESRTTAVDYNDSYGEFMRRELAAQQYAGLQNIGLGGCGIGLAQAQQSMATLRMGQQINMSMIGQAGLGGIFH